MTENKLQRHIGRITNTGTTCVVLFTSIPEREDHALIVEPESLPPKYGDAFADLVGGREGQDNHDLPALLSRKIFPSGENMLQALHQNGFLRAEPITNITMLVTRHDTMPLIDIVNSMRSEKNQEPLAGGSNPKPKTEAPEADISNDLIAELKGKGVDAKEEIKTGMEKGEAQALLDQAKELQERAYELDPNLKPKKKGRPKKNG